MPITKEQLVGTWRLVSWVRIEEGRQASGALGPGAEGMITYTADGFMFAMLAAAGRKPFAGESALEGSPEECHHAMSTGLAYCGRYQVEGDTVIHTVELSMFPNWVATRQLRYCRLDGDRVVLRTPPIARRGISGVAELTWRRA